MCIVHPAPFLGSFCNPVFLKALRGAVGRFGGRFRWHLGSGVLRAAWYAFNWRRERSMGRSRALAYRASLAKELGPSQSTLKARVMRSPSTGWVGGGGTGSPYFSASLFLMS